MQTHVQKRVSSFTLKAHQADRSSFAGEVTPEKSPRSSSGPHTDDIAESVLSTGKSKTLDLRTYTQRESPPCRKQSQFYATQRSQVQDEAVFIPVLSVNLDCDGTLRGLQTSQMKMASQSNRSFQTA
jgi:hypothetical protein